MICSSLMLITNKLAVHNLPAPQFVLFSQPFTPACAAFLGTIFCNLKTLQYCNVETFIVFRASTPIAVAIGDYLFLGRELPSYRSLLCLLGLIIGVSIYTLTDAGFEINGYFWLGLWYIIFLMDQLYIKYVCKKVEHKSNW